MKAVAVFPGSQEVKLIDCEEPQITQKNQAKLRMLEVGICGTDRDICAFQYGAPPKGSDYLIIGHESLGEVVEVGSAVHDLKIGDLVVPMVRRPCSHPSCRGCQSGRPDFCETGEFVERGIKGRHGFMAEFAVDDERYMCVIPHSLRSVAVLVEPLTIAEKSAQQARKIQQRLPWLDHTAPSEKAGRGMRAMVLGAGAIGLLGAMILQHEGFDTYVYSLAPAPNPRSQLVESIGASYISAQPGSIREIERLIGTVDIVYEAAGDPKTAVDMLKLLNANGIFLLTGVPSQKVAMEIDKHWRLRDLVLKNQVIVGIVNAGKESFTAAIRHLGSFDRSWPKAVDAIISNRIPITSYRNALLGTPSGVKTVITVGSTYGTRARGATGCDSNL